MVNSRRKKECRKANLMRDSSFLQWFLAGWSLRWLIIKIDRRAIAPLQENMICVLYILHLLDANIHLCCYFQDLYF